MQWRGFELTLPYVRRRRIGGGTVSCNPAFLLRVPQPVFLLVEHRARFAGTDHVEKAS